MPTFPRVRVPEKVEQAQIVQLLRSIGGAVYVLGTRRLRPEQAEFGVHCLSAGVSHVVGGLDDVIAWLVAGGWLSSANLPHYRQPENAS